MITPPGGGDKPSDRRRAGDADALHRAAEREILARLDLVAVCRDLGLEIAGSPTHKGWLPVHAVGRKDAGASAAVGVEGEVRGRCVDQGGSGTRCSLWELAVLCGKAPDWRAARQHFADLVGVQLPAGVTHSTADQPCPVCGGGVACYWQADGLHLCYLQGRGDVVPGWRLLGQSRYDRRAWLWRRRGAGADAGRGADEADDFFRRPLRPDLAIVEAALADLDMVPCGRSRDWTTLLFRPATKEYLYVLSDREPPPGSRPPWWPHLATAARLRGYATGEEVKAAEMAAWASECGDQEDVARWKAEGERLAAALPDELAALTPAARVRSGLPAEDPFTDADVAGGAGDAGAEADGGLQAQAAAAAVPAEPGAGTAAAGGSPAASGVYPAITCAGVEPLCRSKSLVEANGVYTHTPPHPIQPPGGCPQENSGDKEAGRQVNPPSQTPGDAAERRHGRLLLNCTPRPCPARHGVQLAQRRDRPKGMGLEVRCRRWGCVACIDILKAAWADNLWRRLHALAAPVYRWRGPAHGPVADPAAVGASGPAAAVEALAAADGKAWFGAAKRAVQRQRGNFCRVELAAGEVLVIATAPFTGGETAPAADAAREVVDAVCAVPLVLTEHRRKAAGRRVTYKPVTTSRGWSLPDERTCQWQRLSQPKELDRANDVLVQMGVEVMESPPTKPGGVQRRFIYKFPEAWDAQAVACALGWAECLTVPEGLAPGEPPPDPDQVWRELVAAAALLPGEPPAPAPQSEPRPGPAAPPRAKPAPPTVPRPLEFMLLNVVRLDPDGRYRVAEQGPDGTVFRWSRRAYRTREATEAALAGKRFRLAAVGAYLDRVEFAPDPPPPDKTPGAAEDDPPTAAA